jgi:ATP-dependent Clp protease ATP-binding subunit ClpA
MFTAEVAAAAPVSGNVIRGIRHDRDVAQLSEKVSELLREAEALATKRGHFMVGTEHVLLAMTRQTDESFARRLLDDVGATEQLRARIEAAIGED